MIYVKPEYVAHTPKHDKTTISLYWVSLHNILDNPDILDIPDIPDILDILDIPDIPDILDVVNTYIFASSLTSCHSHGYW
jgi:hypothetical protein